MGALPKSAAATDHVDRPNHVDPLLVFRALAESKAIGVFCNCDDLIEAVDWLQDHAIRQGLIELVGQDYIQQILHETFGLGLLMVDEDMEDYEDELMVRWERDFPAKAPPPAAEQPVVAASTIETFKFLLRQGDSERLRAWLGKHSAEEVATLNSMLARAA